MNLMKEMIEDAIFKIDYDGFIFSLNEEEKTASLIGNNNTKSEIIIPYSVIYERQEFIVTNISEGAFKFSYGIKTVKFPINSKVEIIGRDAFSKSSIEQIFIPSSVTQISECSFSNCAQLKEVKFEKNSKLKIIERGVFFKSSIESIVIPSSVTKISEYAFYQSYNQKARSF